MFSSYTILSLANENKVTLDENIGTWVRPSFSKTKNIKNLLSHTLIGSDSNQFFYDPRFSVLTKIIEKSNHKPFSETLMERVKVELNAPNIVPYTRQGIKNISVATGNILLVIYNL